MEPIFIDTWKEKGDKTYKETVIKPGDFAKIGKLEGFWVKINEIYPNDRFVGQINNRLLLPANYKEGNLVSFHRNNIIDFKSSKTVVISDTDYVFYRGLSSRK